MSERGRNRRSRKGNEADHGKRPGTHLTGGPVGPRPSGGAGALS